MIYFMLSHENLQYRISRKKRSAISYKLVTMWFIETVVAC